MIYSGKDIKRILLSLFSAHWYRVLKIEFLKTQTDKFYLNLLRERYWIEGFIDGEGTARFHVFRRRKVKKGIRRKEVYKNKKIFPNLKSAQRFIFSVTDRKLSIDS